MEYKVIKTQSVYDLEVEVGNYLDLGWKLQGGVAILKNEMLYYYQAIYKE